MVQTAEVVAERYKIGRDRQDEYSYESQSRMAAAQSAGRFDSEIIPVSTVKREYEKESDAISDTETTVSRDECNRPDTEVAALSLLPPILEDGDSVTAGNSSQLSDGASACLVMESGRAESLGIEPLGLFRGMAVVGCDPEEMGLGPVFAVPKLLTQHGLDIEDVDLWELNEAFAVQVLACQDRLCIPSDRLNVNGGAIAMGHPYGMTGSRMVGHAILEGRRRKCKNVVVTMCIGGGQGMAALFEVF